MCDQGKLASDRNCGDLQVVRANSMPRAFQIVLNLCVFVRGSFVEWE